MNANAVVSQDIVTFIAEGVGRFNSVFEAMQKVSADLGERLDSLRAAGIRPVVSSISHSSGYDGHNYFASLVAVLDLHR